MKTSSKEKLTQEEILRIMALQPETEVEKNARNYFLFSFYTYGMRTADLFLLKWSNIKEDRLNYTMMKTETIVPEIRLSPAALNILDDYRGKDDIYVFPPFYGVKEINFTNTFRVAKVSSALVVINRTLKTIAHRAQIDKNITMHVSRHSFANISKDQGISVEVLKEMLCHSDIKITYQYLSSFNNSKLQSAGDSVYGLFG
ncbi:MAG: integrase/recombinase XerD [Arcticibacterium sp.]|jgi:integrase/recombinase XerD